jgi:hypothetical protein
MAASGHYLVMVESSGLAEYSNYIISMIEVFSNYDYF